MHYIDVKSLLNSYAHIPLSLKHHCSSSSVSFSSALQPPFASQDVVYLLLLSLLRTLTVDSAPSASPSFPQHSSCCSDKGLFVNHCFGQFRLI